MGTIALAEDQCYVTILTSESYLPGAVILAHSLDRHGSRHPLRVMYTSKLSDAAVAVLNAEAKRSGRIIPMEVELLLPRSGQESQKLAAERFRDTFTKLRIFQLWQTGCKKVAYLDADMAVYQNPDDIFDVELPAKNWLGANHACVCNLDHDSFAPPEWNKGNCAYTTLSGPDEVVKPIAKNARPTYRLLNSGTLLFNPSQELWDEIMGVFNTSEKLRDYQFPDQDFLADVFWDRWLPISWKFNALKTMRYWHPNMWSDDKVSVLHYIVDNPWERQVSEKGIGGHLGRDGETHQWWWNIYHDWTSTQEASGSSTLKTMERLINTNEPFTEYKPLPQKPGTPEDVLPDSES